MSVNLVNKDGSLSKVAGKIASGTLVPSVSLYQTGIVRNAEAIGAGSYIRVQVTFDEPMPDNDYTVNVDTRSGDISLLAFCDSYQKSKSGFYIIMTNLSSNTFAANSVSVMWQAFKLMTDENRALDETTIAQNTSDISDLQGDKQDKTLETPLTIDDTLRTTVEGALGGLQEEIYSANIEAEMARYEIGDITALETTDQTDLVSAINELVHKINAL